MTAALNLSSGQTCDPERPAISGASSKAGRWSADEIDLLCQMVSMGATTRSIALALDRSQAEVRAKARSLDRMA